MSFPSFPFRLPGFAPPALVLDLGASRVAAALVARRRDGGLCVRRLHVEPVRRADPESADWLEPTVVALRALVRRTKLQGFCRIALPGEATLLRTVRTPTTNARSPGCAMRFEAEQSIPLPLSEVIWDHLPIQVVDGNCDALLAASRERTVRQLCEDLREIGLEPLALEPSGFAFLQSWRFAGGDDSALALSIGARSTHLAFAAGDRFCLRTVEIGGRRIALRVAETLGQAFPDAETIIRRAAHAPDRTPAALREAVECVAGELRVEIARFAVRAAELLALGRAPASVRLAGGAARIPGLADALARSVGVGRVDFARRVAMTEGAGGRESPAEIVGLASGLVDRDRPSLNLVPKDVARSVRCRRRQPAVLAAVAVAAAAPVPALIHYRSESALLADRIELAGRRAAALRRIEDERRAQDGAIAEAADGAARLRAELARRVALGAGLADLRTRVAGMDGVWIEEIRLVDPGALDVAILARAESRAPFGEDGPFRRLRESPHVDSLEETSLETREDGARFACVLRFAVAPRQ